MAKGKSLTSGQQLRQQRQNKRENIEQNLGLKPIDVAAEIRRLEISLKKLHQEYEQFFVGAVKYQPDSLHSEVKRLMAKIRDYPFKRAIYSFRLRTLEQRYQVFNNYWQRVIQQKENGKFSKDVFRADLKERFVKESRVMETREGKANKKISELFDSYKQAFEKQTGKRCGINFEAFQKSVLERAQAFKADNQDKKLKFKVVIKDGKVILRAEAY